VSLLNYVHRQFDHQVTGSLFQLHDTAAVGKSIYSAFAVSERMRLIQCEAVNGFIFWLNAERCATSYLFATPILGHVNVAGLVKTDGFCFSYLVSAFEEFVSKSGVTRVYKTSNPEAFYSRSAL